MGDGTGGVLAVGDATVDLYPVDDEPLAAGSAFEWHVGGTATNVARWLAALGDDATLVTNVGSDTAGEMAAAHLDATRVRTEHVTRVDAPSPLTLYVPTADEDRWDAWVRGSCYGFTPPDDPAALAASHDWVHLEGVTLPDAVNGPAVRRLAAAARDRDTPVAFDLNGRRNQWERPEAYRSALRGVLPHCSLVFAGTADLAVAGLDQTPDGLRDCLPADHSGTAFLTDGPSATVGMRLEDGAVVERVSVPPPTVSVATPAGAGDAFAAAVLAARRRGVTDLRELTAIGNAAGAAAVTTPEPFAPDVAGAVAERIDDA
ncbi:MAG: carbohydrate kinase family protein [Halorubrum sp.]